ncbi:SCAR-like protein 2 isoform X2 [Tasmannia lanceolata]|uniref:SCAR-like protein 2 isoform X2 n=1 Tax=Tasmannia lanceolata TaxID=3420 RepID=UPI004062AAC0
MPLIRYQVRNEYGLGDPELYRAANKDDPKSILDGISVSGLVGILRQLGDLAEFAAEVFHDLREQVSATTARGRQMTTRLQRIEAALPSLEKAVLAQASHIHFAYTAGSDWHPKIQIEQNHLGHSDLPRFIMESYEECRDPPRLFLLDKFDTAGAGACLKRYTDPSLFKKIWASSELTKAETVQRERKTHKIKKKRSRQRNGEVSRAASISSRHRRVEFAFPDTDSQSFAAGTISTSDTSLKSELANRPTSFDSGTRSSYIECVFDANSSIGPEELEHNELSSPKFKMPCTDTHGSVLADGQNREGAADDTQQGPLQGQSAPRSSTVTWDEKAEIVEPTSQLCDLTLEECALASEFFPVNFDPSILEQEAANLGNVDQEDILFDVGNIPELISGINQFGEVTSETDHYMDALNTMESEIDTDSECQTKREVELQSKIQMAAQNSDSKGMTSNLSNSVLSESLAQSPQVIGVASKADNSVNTGLCESPDATDMSRVNDFAPIVGDPSSGSSVLNSHGNKNAFNSCKSQESAGIDDIPSIRLWTNGTLLGVEPSKPLDFSGSDVVSHIPTPGTSTDNCDHSSDTVLPHLLHDGYVGKSGALVRPVEDRKQSSSPVEDQDGPSDAHHCRIFSGTHGHGLTEASVESPRAQMPVISKIDVKSSELGRKNIESPSSISGLSYRFLVNGVHSNISEPSSIENTNPMKFQERPRRDEQKREIGVGSWTSHKPTPTEQLGLGSGKNSISSKSWHIGHPSPPLQHMKISFHPIDDLETSKLKLQFSNRHHFCESFQDGIFPSFELLPEPSIPMQDIGSESDDDTFCKSSPYLSEDPLSPRSESNSEQWESSETTGSKDQEIYDALHRVSSTSSICSPLELDEISQHSVHSACEIGGQNTENRIKSFDVSPSLDLPNSVMSRQEGKGDPDAKDLLDPALQYSRELPPPPPLPPLQWRIMNAPFALVENKQHTISETGNQPNELQVLVPITPQQPKSAVSKQPHFEETIVCSDNSLQNLQNLKGHTVKVQPANGKELEEKEDVLHQIRTKSFNLKHTVTTRPSLMPQPTTNINVSAILEKANAIRQAFASRDNGGDNENWSDD